ncbi:MAG: TraE/TraK family type IV conjugative transfer system protein [Candidatus Binatia bacterium]
MAAERKFWEVLAEGEYQRLVLVWVSLVLTMLVIALSIFLVRLSIRPKQVVVVPGAVAVGLYSAGEMPESVIVDFARNFVVDLANFTPVSAEKGFLSAARYMSPELLSRFEPTAREQLKQLVGNRVSQFFTIDSYSIEGRGPFVVKFLGERVTYVGRTETERKPYQFRVSIRNVESTHENPYGLLVTSVEQTDATAERPGVVKSDR